MKPPQMDVQTKADQDKREVRQDQPSSDEILSTLCTCKRLNLYRFQDHKAIDVLGYRGRPMRLQA